MNHLVFFRKKKHKVYLENRIHDLHRKIINQVIDDGTVDQFSRKLLLKYSHKLKNLK